VTVRAFDPGRDEAAWIAVNNRAFAHDPDQGGWVEATLRRREHEPWFDPASFLLAEDDRGLAGFCWTKLHPAAPPIEPVALGEIYVIGVDPSRQGIGLGRTLTLAGLADLHDRRHAPVGMLFVDASNDAARHLYESIGFTVARVDWAYACDL
jgi:mycothiol synthase